ncbi:NTP transferase domain-containing protein, partial [Alphaproteobacteria bacterium]|nr:NTP transferase domain-containing protein [Alphaproteobacteria bacterium]
MKIVTIIPAHLASIRLPQKILMNINGLPMIEHVRRRINLCSMVDQAIVATGDKDIKECVESYGGKVIKTKKKHLNGTSRVAEAIKNIDCSHVLLIQGDEPLILPRHINYFLKEISKDNENDAWNTVANLNNSKELETSSFVKCSIAKNGRILYLFRKSPSFSSFDNQQKYIKKILGVICYKKNVILDIAAKKASHIEKNESIEQIKL